MSESLLEILLRALGVNPGDYQLVLRPPIDHQSNRLYDVRTTRGHFIAKEFLKPEEIPAAPLREFRALQMVAPLDVAPRPIFFDPALGPVVVYEYLDGEPWGRHRPAPDELAALAKLWLKAAEIPADGLWTSQGYEQPWAEREVQFRGTFRRYADWTASRFPPGQRAAELCLQLAETRREVWRALAASRPIECFCRPDQRFANVIRRPDGRLAMVDWEDSGLRDPARDVADLLTHANQEDLLAPAEWESFLRPYLAARRAVDPTLADRVHLCLAVAPLFWLALLIGLGMSRVERGALAGWTVNGLPANARLRRYLARASAWPTQDFGPELAALSDIFFFPYGT